MRISIFNPILAVLFLLCVGVLFAGCNRDEEIEALLKPEIELDSDTGVYSVKIGGTLTIAPVFKNADGAVIEWRLDDDTLLATGPVWESTWTEEGTYYVIISATTDAGTTEEDIRIDVLELTPPIISLALPAEGLRVMSGTPYILKPDYQHDDMEGFAVRWYVDGQFEGNEPEFTFVRAEKGSYTIRIEAENIDGKTSLEFVADVLDSTYYTVRFSTPSYYQNSTTRYTFAGRPVLLAPETLGFDAPEFSWTVDGVETVCKEPLFIFTPESAGEYAVDVTVRDGASKRFRKLTRNVGQAPDAIMARVMVVCVDATEADRYRPATASSQALSDKVFEYVPAPGQFINETAAGGDLFSHEEACLWAEGRLLKGSIVSLGAYGGYIIVGFDHSIKANTGDYDFAVQGNAFLVGVGNSNEPGIVWVMQDVNGNGLPDDEWYELKGSEYDAPSTVRDYSVTYYRPAAPGMDVEWTDNAGGRGCVDYVGSFHKQDYYYPAWITASSYTLGGSRIAARNFFDDQSGYWRIDPCEWGYVDNIGSDGVDGLDGQFTGFQIDNAVYSDGKPVGLEYVDFIKVQVATQGKCGWLGEMSTEVLGFRDL